MNYKIEGAIKRNKSKFIICAVLWLILVIVLVAPLAYSSFQVKQGASLEIFIETCKWYYKSICNFYKYFCARCN